MAEKETSFDLLRKSILAMYSAPTERPNLINITRHLTDWDEQEFDGKEFEGQKTFEELQSLSAFLENKGLSAQSDEIFRLILHTFPEKYFPSLPWLKDSKDIDLQVMDDAKFVLESRNYPDYVQESFRLFDEHFRKVNRTLPSFVQEVEMNMFKERGSGDAGELFRRFADVADKLHSTSLKDISWTLMNQLAMKLNNKMNAFNAAYMFLKGLDEVKIARPSQGLRDDMRRNESFFLRNFYWKNIDEATAKNDFANLVFYIDKFLPMVETGYERSNLLMLRDNALRQINEIPKGCVTFIMAAFVLLIVVSIILSEPDKGKRRNLDKSRKQILVPKKENDTNIESTYGTRELSEALEVKSRTGLRERKPPVRPHYRKLNLFEIRHVIFQKMRLDYLSEQKLNDEEQHQLDLLLKDYADRCEFYKYDSGDREKVHWDAKIYSPRIIQDAQDHLAGWRLKKYPADFVDAQDNQLLSTNNPVHVKIILERLQIYGYYKEPTIPSSWDESAKRALLDFKVSNMGVVNSDWDSEAQKYLFGK